MKILLQDRQKIVEMPREIWIAENAEDCTIVGSAYITPYLGNYPTKQRAQEVIGQMFEYYRNGKNSYVMPTE